MPNVAITAEVERGGQARFKRADICVFRQDILHLYYDILACYQLLSAVNDNAQKREIKAHINKAISLAHNTDSQSVLNARNALSKMFDGKYKQNFTFMLSDTVTLTLLGCGLFVKQKEKR